MVHPPSADRSPALSRWLHPDGLPWGQDPHAWDANHVAAVKRSMDLAFGPYRYFRLSVSGWGHLPDTPAMIVSNHSGGTTVLDGMGFGHAWTQRFGTDRPLRALVHDLLFSTRLTGPFFARLGAVRASRQMARQVLHDAGHDLLVFPGGDQDTWRPFRERYRVRFAGRTGYARIALEQGVPVVPLAHAGAQESFFVLTSGQSIARYLGIHRLARAEIWPLHVSLPWGLALGPLPHLPLPVRLDYRIGPVVPFPTGHRVGQTPPPAMVRAYDQAVRDAIQGLLDDLCTARRHRLRRRAQGTMRWLQRALSIGSSPRP